MPHLSVIEELRKDLSVCAHDTIGNGQAIIRSQGPAAATTDVLEMDASGIAAADLGEVVATASPAVLHVCGDNFARRPNAEKVPGKLEPRRRAYHRRPSRQSVGHV
jgi:hypothetical protein